MFTRDLHVMKFQRHFRNDFLSIINQIKFQPNLGLKQYVLYITVNTPFTLIAKTM